MLAQARFEKIIELVDEKGVIQTRELAQKLDVTETTIRRDCETLEKQGLLKRIHGGAKSIHKDSILTTYKDKTILQRVDHFKEKEMVAKAAVNLVEDGNCIFIDGGSTTACLMKYLNNKNQLRIITPNRLVVNEFKGTSNELYAPGGKYSEDLETFYGPLTIRGIESFNYDIAFISCTAVNLETGNITTRELDTMEIKVTAIEKSIKKVLLIDSSKLFLKGFYGPLNLKDFDVILCNDDPLIDQRKLPDNFIIVKE